MTDHKWGKGSILGGAAAKDGSKDKPKKKPTRPVMFFASEKMQKKVVKESRKTKAELAWETLPSTGAGKITDFLVPAPPPLRPAGSDASRPRAKPKASAPKPKSQDQPINLDSTSDSDDELPSAIIRPYKPIKPLRVPTPGPSSRPSTGKLTKYNQETMKEVEALDKRERCRNHGVYSEGCHYCRTRKEGFEVMQRDHCDDLMAELYGIEEVDTAAESAGFKVTNLDAPAPSPDPIEID